MASKYSIKVEYGKDDTLNPLGLRLYFMDDHPSGKRVEEFFFGGGIVWVSDNCFMWWLF